MKPLFIAASFITLLSACSHMVPPAEGQRQTEVSQRSVDVMPFDLAATTHIFTKLKDGGTQRVVAKNPEDATQIKQVREHLHVLQAQFQAKDFSGPAHIHGDDMPGLAELRASSPGQLTITYRDVPGGAELAFRTKDATLIAAIHKWFDAQLADHGADAMEGHHSHSD